MNRVGIHFGLVLLIVLPIVEGKGFVSFWRNTVTLICPKEGNWFNETGGEINTNTKEHIIQTDEQNQQIGKFQCQYEDNSTMIYQFYVKGKGCKNCYELNMTLIALVVVGDLLLTAGVFLIVYLLVQMRSGPAAPQKRVPAPAVPHPDYEPLRAGTRGKDIYASHRNETTE